MKPVEGRRYETFFLAAFFNFTNVDILSYDSDSEEVVDLTLVRSTRMRLFHIAKL